MMTVLFELSVPIFAIIVAWIVRGYLKVVHPTPLALGCIIPKLCAVGSEEIIRYNEVAEGDHVAKHLRRKVRWMQFKVNSGYLREMEWNTTLFQRALEFEKIKVDPSKSALEHQPREVLALEMVDEAAVIRWSLFKWQVGLRWRAVLGLGMDQQVFIDLLAHYKHLEHEMVTLASMAEDDCFHQMLIERLGLTKWRLLEGNSPS